MPGEQSLEKVFGQAGEFAKGLTPRQRWMLAGGALMVVATLTAFVALVNRPEYKTLVSGVTPGEAQRIAERLKARGIEHEVTSDGSVRVGAEKLEAGRMEVASGGVPAGGRLGFELFDKPNWGGSEFNEKVNYQRALEAELERSIQTLTEVEGARVHLTLPSESLFSDREREPKAAVILKLRTRGLPDDAQASIAQLVSASVDRLTPENVTVLDANSGRSLAARRGNGPGGDLDEQLVAEVVRTLEPVAGADRIRASVHVEYDLSSSEEEQETYDPATAVALSMQKSEEFTGAGAGAAGVPGTASNVPGAQGAAASPREAGDSHTSRTENGTYAFNKILKRTRQPAGRLKRITAAVLVDDAVETMAGPDGKPVEQRRRRSADELRQIEQLAKAAIGFDAQRGDSLAVENLTFRQAPPVEVSRPAAAERVRRVFQDWAGVVRYGVIALLFAVVYFVLLRPVQKQVLLALRELSSRAKLAQKVSEPGKDVAAVLQGGGALLPESEQPAEVKRAVALKRELAEKVKAEPAAASKLIQTWLSPQRGSLASAARREGSET